MAEADYGLRVWPCAEVLASFIAANRELFNGRKVIEVGCGTALPGIVASKLCGLARLTLSDRASDNRLRDLADKNCELNGVSRNDFNIVGFTWGDFEPILERLTDIDVVLASDCFYDPSVFEDVTVSLHSLLKRNPNALVYFSYQNRCSSWAIEWLLQRYELTCKRLPYVCDEYPSVSLGVISLKID